MTPLRLDSPRNLDAAQLGGKARGLLLLEQSGFAVPPWRVLAAENAAALIADAAHMDSDALRADFETLAGPPFSGVAVRSSGLREDRRHDSAAGLYETRFVLRAEALEEALREVAASGQAQRVRAYAGAPDRVAVIVQSLVKAACAGILFSAHPTRADENLLYVEIVRGAGDALASGTATPDEAWIAAATGSLHGEAARSLPAPVALQLRDAVLALEEAHDAPVDIEWAWDGETLWFLQARPVTRLDAPQPAFCATSWFFDQRFLEPIHPFTRSTLLPIIRRVAIGEALQMRGIHEAPPDFLFHAGQAYLPHAVYRKMLRGAGRWWLTEDLRTLFPPRCGCPPEQAAPGDGFVYVWHSFLAVLRHLPSVFLNIPCWSRFQTGLPERIHHVLTQELPWTEKWSLLDRLTLEFLRLHRWSILWADYAYRAFRLSVAPLPQRLRQCLHDALRTALRLPTAAANAALARALDPQASPETLAAFTLRFGHRSGSLDYAAPTWAELAASGRLASQYRAAPDTAEKLPPPRRAQTARWQLARLLLWPLVRLLEMREEQRFAWERILAAQRGLLCAQAENWVKEGWLDRVEEVWFLTWDETCALAHHDPEETRRTIARRRRAHRLESAMRRPLFIGPLAAISPDSCANLLHGLPAASGMGEGRALHLTHPAQFDATRHDGCVLVLRALDPAWTPLLPHIAGLVIERGGLLSHAALLAREYGVPLVIGVADACERIPENTLLRVDGDAGTVALLRAPAEDAISPP